MRSRSRKVPNLIWDRALSNLPRKRRKKERRAEGEGGREREREGTRNIGYASFAAPGTYDSVAATRKRSLSCYIRNERTLLKTKNGKKRERGKRERRRERERDVVRSTGFPTEFTLRCIPRRCGPHAANASVGGQGGMYARGGRISIGGECGPRIAVRYKVTLRGARSL